MKLTTIKLDKFNCNLKVQEFLNHLESIPSMVNFVVVGEAILLEFEPQNASIVYYSNSITYLRNEPIIALGRDCEAFTDLSDWDFEQLELKRMINNQGWV